MCYNKYYFLLKKKKKKSLIGKLSYHQIKYLRFKTRLILKSIGVLA